MKFRKREKKHLKAFFFRVQWALRLIARDQGGELQAPGAGALQVLDPTLG